MMEISVNIFIAYLSEQRLSDSVLSKYSFFHSMSVQYFHVLESLCDHSESVLA